MPVILVEVYDALLDAGASEAKARTAAAVILCEHRLVAIGRRQNLVTAEKRVADLIEPMSGLVTPLLSPVDGVLYVQERRRFVPTGTGVLRVAGREAVRTGNLLSA